MARDGAGEALLRDAATVIRARRRIYGEPDALFEQVARRWSLTLGTRIGPAQVVLCLLDLKLARLAHGPTDADSQLDLAGYAAVLRAVAGNG